MLTKRQKAILDFIKSHTEKNEYAPSLEEIKSRFKFASVSTAHFHVSKLKERGYLENIRNKARALSIPTKELLIKVPLLGTIAAGEPIEAIQQNDFIAVSKSKLPYNGSIFALRVVGNSMIDENINDGDIVLVKQQYTAKNGQRVVALIDNDEATLKKFYKEHNHIRLQPANKMLEPIIIKRNKDIKIQGIVIDVVKEVEGKKEATIQPITINNRRAGLQVKANQIICSDCVQGLKKLPDNFIDGCITDPPYNYEFIGHKWNEDEIKRRTERIKNSNTLIKHIPYGSGLAGGVRNKRWYQKNADNITDYQNWCYEWGKEVFRVLKPGAYTLVFNSSRTIAHVQVALERAGFYARDIIVWRKNSGIPKGLNFVKKLDKEGISDSEKWLGWHSCLRNEWEAIVMVQKPLINNYLETVKEFDIGLLHTKNWNGSGGFQSNIIENIKRDEKEAFNIHCTVKPIELIKKLIDLTVPLNRDKIILDPFMGSGTTAIAASAKGISYLGYEINKDYCHIANKRIEDFAKKAKSKLF